MRYVLIILCCIIEISFVNLGICQSYNKIILKGIVIDSITSEVLSYVAVKIEGTAMHCVTNDKGAFELLYEGKGSSLSFSSLGYQTRKILLSPNSVDPLLVKLSSQTVAVKEVVFNRKKAKYNKQNPAVALIENVIAHKNTNSPSNQPFYQCEHYEKVVISVENITTDITKKFFGRRSVKINEFLDTCDITGNVILSCSVREKTQDVFFRKYPKKTVKIVQGINVVEATTIIDDETMRPIISNIFTEVNLFDNNINLLLNHFPSPLSSTMATSFYKYYIKDTLIVEGKECIELMFAPFNPQSFSFTGYLYITNDSTFSLIRSKIYIPKVTNVNYVKKYILTQEFEKCSTNIYYLKRNDAVVEMGLPGISTDVQIRNINVYRNYLFDSIQQHLFENPDKFCIIGKIDKRGDLFWQSRRTIPLKKNEDNVNALMNLFFDIPWIKIGSEIVDLFISGYVETHKDKNKSFFDIGSVTTLVSYNSVEGIRLRLGGMTTANLHPHFFISGYAAYGFKDKKWKYNGELTYSFHSKKYFKDEYPIHSLSLLYEYDTKQQGEEFLFTNKDNFFTSFKVSGQSYMTYDRRIQLTWQMERSNGFSMKLWFNNLVQEPAGLLQFEKKNQNGEITQLSNMKFNEVAVLFRYAPSEKLVQTKRARYLVDRDIPIFSVSHRVGVIKFGEINIYHKTEFSFQKRIYLSAFGYLNSLIRIGKVWSPVPFTILGTPNINNSIIIQPESYNLINSMEFLHDEYIQLQLEYHLNGLIFNRLPKINQLLLREVVGIKGYWGNLTPKNDPDKYNHFLLFPHNPIGKTLVTKITAPYWEMNVGIENIFTIGRIDYVCRINYRNSHRAIRHGIRLMLYFRF